MNPDFEQATKRFNRLGELGRGESTIVELIYDEERHTTLARKRWERTNAETRFRMKQQFRRALAVQHPNVVRVYDLQADAQETCLTMEAVSGGEVVSYVRGLATSGASEAQLLGAVIDVLRQLTAALVALHGAGIVHRDVKPRNVLIEPSGRVVLLDAGFAWPPEQHFDPQRDRALAGTLPYLAPECLRGALPSVEADWYSLGALASELLCGAPPFSGAFDAIVRAKDQRAQDLREVNPSVPEALDDLVCALLERDPNARPTAEEVQALLESLAAEFPRLSAAATVPLTAADEPSEVLGASEPQRVPTPSDALEPAAPLLDDVPAAPTDLPAIPVLAANDQGAIAADIVAEAYAEADAMLRSSSDPRLDPGEQGLPDAEPAIEDSALADRDSTPPLAAAEHPAAEEAACAALLSVSDDEERTLPTRESGVHPRAEQEDEAASLARVSEAAPSIEPAAPAEAFEQAAANTKPDDTATDAADILRLLSALDELPGGAGADVPRAAFDEDDARRPARVAPSKPVARPSEQDALAALYVYATVPDESIISAAGARDYPSLQTTREEPSPREPELANVQSSADAVLQPSAAPAADETPSDDPMPQQPWAADPRRSTISDLVELAPPPRSEPPPAGRRSSSAPPPPPSKPRGGELDPLDEWLLREASGARALLVRGAAGSGKTRRVRELAARAAAQPNWLVLRAHPRSLKQGAFTALREIMAQLIARWRDEPLRSLPRALSSPGAVALSRCLPQLAELVSRTGVSANLAGDVQRRWVDALLTFRALFAELAERQPTLIAIDAVSLVDHDSLRLLHSLLHVAPAPKLRWLFAQDSEAPVPAALAWLVEPSESDPVPVLLHDLDAQPLSGRRTRPPLLEDDTIRILGSGIAAADSDTATLALRAEAATAELALHEAAELYALATRDTQDASPALLQAAAEAHARAGRLREASELWLALARRTPDPAQAQQHELAAGAALLRAGDEERGRELLQGTLRACSLHWPRAPLLTSTLERARLLFQPSRQPPPPPDKVVRRQRFDVLWGVARELVLLAPTTGDALSMRALREALLLGDPSRLSWVLGYEAASEANIGGTYMRHRASTLAKDAEALAQQSGDAFDIACARGVAGVVAWFAGQWSAAEVQLRAALNLFSTSSVPSAHERHVLENFLIGALEAQGKLDTLRSLLPDLQLTAAATGHALAGALCTLAQCSLLALANDRPLEAIARADAVLAQVGGDSFTPLHFQHFVATTSARLYAGHNAQAFQEVQDTWLRVRHTYLPQLDAVAVMLHQLRARAAIALAVDSPPDESARLSKLAGKLSHALESSSLPHAAALSQLVLANLALLRGRSTRADKHCEEASEIFEACGMQLMSEVARYARGVIGESSAAQQDVARARSYFERRGVQQPSAFVNAWFPALRRLR